MSLGRAGGNRFEGDRFFDREVEIAALLERAEDGTHTLVTARRRMAKTSLVGEVLRRSGWSGRFATVSVDLEDAVALEPRSGHRRAEWGAGRSFP